MDSITDRGARVVAVDPRRTGTAAHAVVNSDLIASGDFADAISDSAILNGFSADDSPTYQQ